MMTRNRWITAVLATLLLPAAALAAPADDSGFAVIAKRIYTGEGAPLEDGVLVVRAGKVASVGADAPAALTRIDRSDAVVVPGFVDVRAAVGAMRDLSEPTTAIQGDVRADDVLDPFHRDFGAALRAGITTVVLVPRADNLVGGTAVAVKCAGASLESRIVRTGGPLALSVARDAAQLIRVPTSRMGAYDLFRKILDEGAGGKGTAPIESFARGSLDGILVCDDDADAHFAMEEIDARGLRVRILFRGPVDEAIDDLAAAKTTVILGPFGIETPERLLRGPAQLAARGIPVVLAGAFPEGSEVGPRWTATLAARHGLARDTAVAAITSQAARTAGIEGRVGSLVAGRDADFVVLSGDPLDLSSRVLEVYIDGKRVVASGDRP